MYATYNVGYSSAKQKYEMQLATQRTLIASLENRESIIQQEIVTVYKDRIKIVEKNRDMIIEVTPNVLREESMRCDIGDRFISLHNAAASNKNISYDATGTNAESSTAETN